MTKKSNNITAKVLRKAILFLGLICFINLHVFSQIFIQAEDYTDMNGIDTQVCSDAGGGLNVGWIDGGDWLKYNVNIPIAGEYVFTVRAASDGSGGNLTIEKGSSSDNIFISSTGGWQNWQSFDGATLTLEQGLQTIKLSTSSGGFNLNWFEFRLVAPEDTDNPTSPEITESYSDVHTISLTWSNSTDETTLVSGYKIFNNGSFAAFANDNTFKLTKLAPETEFNIEIFACDIVGNQSEPTAITISTTEITWELSWADEFEGTEVDRDKWNFETGGYGWGNGESQYYTDGDNASVEDGNLIIEARKETIGSNPFTSTRMNNGGDGSFVYGRAEIRAKLPETGGTWPAIWTLPTDWIYGNWPHCGEIDIMEHTGNNLNYVFGTIHTGAYNHLDGTQQGAGVTLDDVVNTFHTYALEWYPDHLDWYYDDELIFTFANEYKTFEEWPFDIKHHIILNIAVGGGLGGNIDYNGEWPQQMIVDYVRIYDFDLGANDIIPPSAPGNLQAEVNGADVDLTWDISTDNEYVEKYYIYVDDELVDSVSNPNYIVKNLQPNTEYTISVQAKDFGGNVSETVSVTVTTAEVESIEIPGQFEAEDYLYMDGMQSETCTDDGGGENLGYIDNGDWLEYNINVLNAGRYYLATRAASQSSVGKIDLEDGNQTVLTSVQTPATGGWQNWETVVSDGFELAQGVQKIKIVAKANSFNLNWFAITADSSEYATSIQPIPYHNDLIYPNPSNGNEINIQLGKKTSDVSVSINALDGKLLFNQEFKNPDYTICLNNLNLKPGLYLLNITKDVFKSSYKMLIR